MIDNYNFAGKKAIIRVDFNVPLGAQYEVTDDTRIRGALPTIRKVLADGGSAILMSHLGRPKTGPEEKFSLKHVIPTLAGHLGVGVLFADDCIGEQAVEKSAALKPGQVLLLENLRFYSAENKVKTDEEIAATRVFAEKLSTYADVYVNDAFGTAHRAHALAENQRVRITVGANQGSDAGYVCCLTSFLTEIRPCSCIGRGGDAAVDHAARRTIKDAVGARDALPDRKSVV